MSVQSFFRKFRIRGVFWRHYISWAVRNMPHQLQPAVIAFYTLFFYIVWPAGRRSVITNLRAIFPGSPYVMLLLRGYRVFWNFACTFTDTAAYNEQRALVDWEFVGYENLDLLAKSGAGAIILTAHMGNYDLGSFLFAEKLQRQLVTVRVPEADAESEQHSMERRQRAADELRVSYNTAPGIMVIELMEALRQNGIVAIQGDRVVGGVAAQPSTLFSEPVDLPTGPFALAMATGVALFPLFVIRVGRRRYRVVTHPPIYCKRTGRDREKDLQPVFEHWRLILEKTIREYWYQWFTFVPFMKKDAP